MMAPPAAQGEQECAFCRMMRRFCQCVFGSVKLARCLLFGEAFYAPILAAAMECGYRHPGDGEHVHQPCVESRQWL
jgi:hypothetical protein